MEVLTDSGWKTFKDVDWDRDRLATRNQRTHAFEWQKVTAFQRVDWESSRDGNLYHFVSRAIDLMIAPDQSMLVTSLPRALGGSRHRERGEAIVRSADVAANFSGYTGVPLTSIWYAPDVEQVRLPPSTVRAREFESSGDDFAAFMGMYLAEGCAPPPDQVYVSQQPSSKGFVAYQELFRHLLRRDVCHTGKNFVLGHKTLHDYLRPLGKAHEKTVPDLVMNMSARQLRIFWDYYLLGDGSIEKAGRKSKAGRERVWTSSWRLADQLQEIAQKIGYSAAVATYLPKTDTILRDGRVIRKERKRTRYAIGLRRSRKALFQVENTPYSGPVYYVSVPNEVVYVRRYGKAAWCGLSSRH
jgi:hypothetical protein